MKKSFMILVLLGSISFSGAFVFRHSNSSDGRFTQISNMEISENEITMNDEDNDESYVGVFAIAAVIILGCGVLGYVMMHGRNAKTQHHTHTTDEQFNRMEEHQNIQNQQLQEQMRQTMNQQHNQQILEEQNRNMQEQMRRDAEQAANMAHQSNNSNSFHDFN